MSEKQKLAILDCQQGNLESFSILYDDFCDKIYSFIYYRVNHRETAEDLTSTTFLKAIENISRCRCDSFSAWLYQIARNTVIDHYRTRKENLPIEEVVPLPSGKNFEKEYEKQDQVREIKSRLRQLDKLQQDVLTMRVWDQLSYKEISQITGKKEGNCKVIFARGVAKLKTSLL